MVAKGQDFTNTPNNQTLLALRTAWVEAYVEWQKVEVFEFGAADRYALRTFFNIYPADVNGIMANINDPTANLNIPAAYARQGFPALDYLINGSGTDDNAILAFYTNHADAAKRKAYITTLLTRMSEMIDNVIAYWNKNEREAFISKTGLDIGSSMGLAVNAYVLHYEKYIRSGKIGIPAGATANSAGVAHPETVEAYYKKDISLILTQTAHQAAVDFFNGKNVTTGENGLGFKAYLNAIGAKDNSSGKDLSSIINDQFTVAKGKIDLLPPDFFQQINTDRSKMIDAFTEMQKAVRMIKVDMTSAMSITITYTDNDGD